WSRGSSRPLHYDHIRSRFRRTESRSAPQRLQAVRREARHQQLRDSSRPDIGGRRGRAGSAMNRFIGVDLGWYGKPSGLASLEWRGRRLVKHNIARLEKVDEILDWIDSEAGSNAVVGVDAPLVIPNQTGIRPAERELNRDFRRFHAGCHAANLGR